MKEVEIFIKEQIEKNQVKIDSIDTSNDFIMSIMKKEPVGVIYRFFSINVSGIDYSFSISQPSEEFAKYCVERFYK